MSEQVSRGADADPDSDSDLGLRMTRREFGLRIARGVIGGVGAYAARPLAREVLIRTGYGVSGRGSLPPFARALYQFWSWGKRWRR